MYDLPAGMHIFQIAEHDVLKPKLLFHIDQIVDQYEDRAINPQGYRYDFGLNQTAEYNPPYKALLINAMENYLHPYAQSLGMKIHAHTRPWFQQYNRGEGFGWHHHDKHFAWIYYAELPDPTEATDFLQYGKPSVKEGDMIIFPSWMVHRSSDILSHRQKTIFSGNVEFYADREHIENQYADR
jgi:hypothetical protein